MTETVSLAQMMADVATQLTNAGFTRGEAPPEAGFRLYEDKYSVIGIAGFETWDSLRTGWPAAQDALVALLGSRLLPGDPKTWEGYLVLITPSIIPTHDRHQGYRIRHDTKYVRKLLGSGDDMPNLRNVLLPVLPLRVDGPVEGGPLAVLSHVPTAMAETGLPRDAVEAVIEAFVGHESVLEALHRWLLEHVGDDPRSQEGGG